MHDTSSSILTPTPEHSFTMPVEAATRNRDQQCPAEPFRFCPDSSSVELSNFEFDFRRSSEDGGVTALVIRTRPDGGEHRITRELDDEDRAFRWVAEEIGKGGVTDWQVGRYRQVPIPDFRGPVVLVFPDPELPGDPATAVDLPELAHFQPGLSLYGFDAVRAARVLSLLVGLLVPLALGALVLAGCSGGGVR